MIIGEQVFDLKIINESNGDLISYIPPQMVSALKYNRVINKVGNLVVTLPFNEALWEAVSLDNLFEVYYKNQASQTLEKDETYLLRKKERYFEEGLPQMAFSCVGLLDLINRRIVKPTNTDDSSAGGFVTRAGTAGTVIGEFINEQMITPDNAERTFPNMTYQKLDDGDSVGLRVRYDNLLETIQKVRVSGGIDIEIERVSDNDLKVKAGLIGTDQSYQTNFPSPFLSFSPLLGNASSPYFSSDNQKTRNFVYALGEGEGVNQYVLELAGAGLSESVYARSELAVPSKTGEGGVTSAAEQTYAAGISKLNESKAELSFSFEILDNSPSHVYREDWDVGDYVTFYWTEALQFRIASVTITSEGAKYTRSVSLELEDV